MMLLTAGVALLIISHLHATAAHRRRANNLSPIDYETYHATLTEVA